MTPERVLEIIAATDKDYYRGASDWPQKFANALLHEAARESELDPHIDGVVPTPITKEENEFLHPAPIPEGFVLVPVEPTEEMIEAAKKCATLNGGWLYVSTKAIWREMIQAAPKGGE